VYDTRRVERLLVRVSLCEWGCLHLSLCEVVGLCVCVCVCVLQVCVCGALRVMSFDPELVCACMYLSVRLYVFG